MMHGLRSLLGALLWLGLAAWEGVVPASESWPGLVLCFSALVLCPLSLEQLVLDAPPFTRSPSLALADRTQLPAAGLLACAFVAPPGVPAALLAAPWAGVCLLLGLNGVLQLGARALRSLASLTQALAQICLSVGGLWALCDRAGFAPLGLPGDLVLLSAVHFHYSGFALPLAAARTLRRRRAGTELATLGVLAGIPLVALAIAGSRLGFARWLEWPAAWTLAAGGLGIALAHLRAAARPARGAGRRALMALAGLALGVSVLLAASYGSRGTFPAQALDEAGMRALHGSLAVVFALASGLAWRR